MAIFEQAMSMWVPFPNKLPEEGAKTVEGAEAAATPAIEAEQQPSRNELDALKSQLEAMQQKIEKLAENKD
jgi:polyhydroxyalkanoate synthesis regulator protein